MKITFKLKEKIKEAWGLYKGNYVSMIILTGLVFAFQSFTKGPLDNGKNGILFLLSFVISLFISYIWINSILNLLDGKGFKPFEKKSLPTWTSFFDYLKTNILIVLCVIPISMLLAFIFVLPISAIFIMGMYGALWIFPILFILVLIIGVPIYYLGARLFLARYLSVEKCQGARKSIIESWSMTKGNGWMIVWNLFLIILFIIAGFIALFLGIFITYPMGMILIVMFYREISKTTPVLNTEIEKDITEEPSQEEIRQEEKVGEKEEVI